MQELVIKVPAPFAGTDEVGFSTRYPEQSINAPLRDVTFFIEGLPELVARLWPYLQDFPVRSRRAGSAVNVRRRCHLKSDRATPEIEVRHVAGDD